MAIVEIERGLQLDDCFRKYIVILDGREIARIKLGQRRELPVATGTHEIYCEIDWCRSNKITFIMETDDQVKRFRVRSARWSFILTPIYITFLRHKYLELKEIQREVRQT